MTGVVRAERRRVWEALTEPDQELRWRPGVMAAVPDPEEGDDPGSAATRRRWRCLLNDLPVTLERTRLAAAPGERLHSALSLGLFRFEEIFTLQTAAERPEYTRVGLRVQARSEIPVVGGALDRFAVRRFATALSAIHLQALRDWCECGVGTPQPLPPLAGHPGRAAGARG